MVLNSIEVKAQSVDLAIEQGLEKLGLSKEEVEVEVLSKGGVFTKANVRLTEIETPQKTVQAFVNELLEKMKLKCYAECTFQDNKIIVNIMGSDSASAIGYRGEVLDAIQYLALIKLNKNNSDNFIKIIVDAENYREKRNNTLNGLARKLAYKASKSGRIVELEPMNPYERRIIHTALQDNKYVETSSSGEGMVRHVVITPLKKREKTVAETENVSLDILGASASHNNFKKNGPKKMRSFGYSRRKF